MSNGFNPDQDQLSLGPDLGPNCLQRLKSKITETILSAHIITRYYIIIVVVHQAL